MSSKPPSPPRLKYVTEKGIQTPTTLIQTSPKTLYSTRPVQQPTASVIDQPDVRDTLVQTPSHLKLSTHSQHIADSSHQTFDYAENTSHTYKKLFCNRVYRRKLGGMEFMYHTTMSKGADMICLMVRVQATFPITEEAARNAMECLVFRHPLLRMNILSGTKDGKRYCDFVENKQLGYDFRVSDRKDWLAYILEEAGKPFDVETSPLLRCRMLNACEISPSDHTTYEPKQDSTNRNGTTSDHNVSNASSLHHSVCSRLDKQDQKLGMSNSDDVSWTHEATFLFLNHHSIMDGGYIFWIVQEFIHLLDAYDSSNIIDLHEKQLPFFSPMENCMTVQCNSCQKPVNIPRSDTESYIEINPNPDVNSDKFLQDYNFKFREEIEFLSHCPNRNSCVVFNLDKSSTTAFRNHCREHKAPATGAILAAGILALIDLVYSKGEDIDRVEVPLEYMVDLRRHCNFEIFDENTPKYPGLASANIPVNAVVTAQKRPVAKTEFWKIAKSFGETVRKDIRSPSTFAWIQNESAKYDDYTSAPDNIGKSPFVFGLSNLGKIDNVLLIDVPDRIRLTEVHGHSSVLIDDMPIFFLTTFSLNGKLCGNISYCEGYTSKQTASLYLGHFLKYIDSSSSKL